MSEATTDSTPETEGASPSASSARAWLRRVVGIAFVSVSVVNLGLFLAGVYGEVTFWRIISFFTLVLGGIIMRQNAELLADGDRWEAMCSNLVAMLEGIRMRPAVRCAGCHDTARLMTATPDENGNVPLPPGWRMQNDRPYCDDCLAKR